MNDFAAALKRFLKLFFPNRCEFCGDVIEFDKTVCHDCENLPIIVPPTCENCGKSKDDCDCKNRKNEYKRIVAPYYYEDKVVKAVHRYKESEMRFLSERFSRDIANSVNTQYSDISFDAVTFVPMRKWDERKRGYNQSEILAEYVSDNINVPIMNLLVKTQRTKPQKSSTARERKVNVFGAFDVIDKEYVNGKTILLIDDVKTTGSTINECAKMLKIYGAKEVYCATLAVVNNKKKNKQAGKAM
ncbi:MAG: ComF family protein [Eubacterium sp.]